MASEQTQPKFLIQGDEFTHKTSLGEGSDGRCALYAKSRNASHVLVVKTFRQTTGEQGNPTHIPREIHLFSTTLRHHTHPNIITYLGFQLRSPIPTEDSMFIEYCNLGTLQDQKELLQDRYKAVPEDAVWNVFYEIASALAFLHTGVGVERDLTKAWVPVLHRDIKPTNICLTKQPRTGNIIAKLTDFGSAVQYNPAVTMDFTYMGGTMDYNPPEYPFQSEASDIWGLGASIHFLCLGEPPVDSRVVDAMDIINDSVITEDEWRKRLPRNAIHVNLSPEKRVSQWDGIGNADKPWEGVYSDKLDFVLQASLAIDLRRRATAVQLMGLMEGIFGKPGSLDADAGPSMR